MKERIVSLLVIAVSGVLLSTAFATTAAAQAGKACAGTVCGLGGQIRGQIGDGLPLPISIAPGYTGPFKGGTTPGGANNAVIKTTPIFNPELRPFAGQGLGQQGQVKASPSATVMQTTTVPGSQGRAVTLPPGVFTFGPAPQGSIGVVNFNNAVFAVQTLGFADSPHPGTNGTGVPIAVPGGGGSRMLSAGGRPGLPTVSFYAGATSAMGPGGSPSNNYNNATPNGAPAAVITAAAGNAGGINGVARFVATGNQFGGISVGRTLGTGMVYFNGVGGGLNPAVDLPCTGTAMCAFQLSTVFPDTTPAGVAGGPFGSTANGAAFTTATGVYTGTIGFNGSILGIGNAVTSAGVNIPFTGQGVTTIGFPITTGRLSITVTDVVVGANTEMFVRTGTDARDASGNGVIATVTGSMSTRSISGGNANRTWTTMEIPEPGAITAASAALLALFGCHQWVRRRNR